MKTDGPWVTNTLNQLEDRIRELEEHLKQAQQAVSVPDVLYDSYAVLQEVRRVRSKSESEEVISLQMTVSDVLDAAVKLIKQEQDDDQ